jgi:hypothetical protein
MEKHSLTQENLAILGALDDFYDAYNKIIELYDAEWNNYLIEKGDRADPYSCKLDDKCKNNVIKIYESFINKYKYIFIDDDRPIHSSTYSFQLFSMVADYKPSQTSYPPKLKMISFSQFLYSILVVVTLTISKWGKTKPDKAYKWKFKDINAHIDDLVNTEKEKIKLNFVPPEDLTDSTLYIFNVLSSTSCYRNNHPVEIKKFVAELSDESGVILPAHYCSCCNKYFIGSITLSLFDKKYGKMLIKKQHCSDEGNSFDNYSDESELHALGYNVIDGDMTDKERQDLLLLLLKKNKIDIFKMVPTIEQDIRLFEDSPRHQLAVKKWKADLQFITMWNANNK